MRNPCSFNRMRWSSLMTRGEADWYTVEHGHDRANRDVRLDIATAVADG
jgi:hypothetical protein